MDTEIYIEGQRADITEDISALFTYAIDDVKDFSSRETGYSKTLVFPGTNRNNTLFGYAFEFAAFNTYDANFPNILSNFNAAKSAKCRVLLHGIQVFKGVLRLMEIKMMDGAIEYEAAMFGELGGLVSAIGNRLLTGNTDTAGGLNVADDLDFSDYNQTWSFTNIIQTWADLATLGYRGYGLYYPLIDYGLCTTDRINFSYQALRPALYVHEYLVKIFEKAGYTIDCPFFETGFFRRLIVPHADDKVYKMVRQLIDNRVAVGYGLFAVTTPTTPPPSRVIDFATSVAMLDFTPTYSFTLGSTFTYTGTDTNAEATTKLHLFYGGGQGNVDVTLELLVNGVAKDSRTYTLYGPSASTIFPPTFAYLTVTLSALITLTSGDVITVRATPSYHPTSVTHAWFFSIQDTSRISVTRQTGVAVPAILGDTLNINNMIPKGVLQKDFLLSIVKMFNLRIVEDAEIDKHVIITPFIDFFDNSDPLDWSLKVDRGRSISLKPMSEVNARYFNFLYEQDSDFDNDSYRKRHGKGYADRTVDVGLDFVKDKKDLKIIFASSPLVGVSGLDKVVTRICKIDSNGVEERIGSKIRILQAKRIGVSSWNVLQDDLTTVVNNTVWYGYAGHVDDPDTPQGADLNFGAPAEIKWAPVNPYLPVNLFAEFHSTYMAEITDKDSKLLTCSVRLSPLEVLHLDFSKSILIDGQLWRLNRLIDYNAVEDDVTKAELLKVINLSY